MVTIKFLTCRHSFFVLLLLLNMVCKISVAQHREQVFMFSYFKGNGEDGLHLASSKDGLLWEALNNIRSVLKPLSVMKKVFV